MVRDFFCKYGGGGGGGGVPAPSACEENGKFCIKYIYFGGVTPLRTASAHWLHNLFHSLISTRTYFFGVSFIEQVQEPADDLSDPELMQYQPLRDMSQDLEKILEHLHSK